MQHVSQLRILRGKQSFGGSDLLLGWWCVFDGQQWVWSTQLLRMQHVSQLHILRGKQSFGGSDLLLG